MSERFSERLMLGVTAARLGQAYRYGSRVSQGKSVAALTAEILAVDQGDGMIARYLGVDGPKRRVTDSIVDAAIIGTGLAAIFRKHEEARPMAALLMGREVFVASGWALDLAKTQQAKRGDIFYKLPSLAVAAFCLAANEGSQKSIKLTGAVALAINAQLAYDYYKGWTEPERTTMLDTGVVEVPGFQHARKVLHRLWPNSPLLGAGDNMPLLITSQEVIDSTCEEIID